MSSFYTACEKRNPGRQAYLVEFRHPLKSQGGRPGKKIRKGLGTTDEAEAKSLVAELNELLREEGLWNLGARSEAEKRFSSRVVEIFYSEIESKNLNARLIRDTAIPFPPHGEGYARVLLIGVPGAGKTTLLRQIIGSHPTRDRFPSTSVNRTTTFPTEVILREGDFSAVVTFLSEHETRFELEECISRAIIEAIGGDREKVATTLLKPSDMRFRLDYTLGEFKGDSDEVDPYDYDYALPESNNFEDSSAASEEEISVIQQHLHAFIDQLIAIATKYRDKVCADLGPLDEMKSEDRNSAIDLIQEEASISDEFVELVGNVLDEIKSKFEVVTVGKFDRSTTGWPVAWHFGTGVENRDDFLRNVRFFSGIAIQSWGKLLTPLVNGIRVSGPFYPSWAEKSARLILIDTEGLSHKASASGDVPEQIVGLFDEVDCIALVDSAKNSLTHFAAGKAMEAVVSAGQTRKLALVFTHMDAVTGDNLKGKARIDHVFGGVRNVVENQIARSVSTDLSRYLLQHLQSYTFFLGRLDAAEAVPAHAELKRLLDAFEKTAPVPFVPVAFPSYSQEKLAFAIQEAAIYFRKPWRARLNFESMADTLPAPWQSIKALSRRYAEGWDDGFHLAPTTNLLNSLIRAISRYLESPLEWSGKPTDNDKREVIERIKSTVTKDFILLCHRRLRERPQPQWNSAFVLKGLGSTYARRTEIEGIYEKSVPIPHSGSDQGTQEFLEEVKTVVHSAIEAVRNDVMNIQE